MINLRLNSPKGGGYYPYVDKSQQFITFGYRYKTLRYFMSEEITTGIKRARITYNIDCFDSIIADGRELLDEFTRDPIELTELVDPEVKLSFKKDNTDFNMCFYGASIVDGSIPEDLFSDFPDATNFEKCFMVITDMVTIPKYIFANNTKVTNFSQCFNMCFNLTTMSIDNDGTPIYNRSGEGKEGYTIVTSYQDCFSNCDSIEGYDQIPAGWK